MVTFLRPLTSHKFNFDGLNGLFACSIAVKWYPLLHCFISFDDRHFYGNCHHKHNSKFLALDFLPPFFPFFHAHFKDVEMEKNVFCVLENRRKLKSGSTFNEPFLWKCVSRENCFCLTHVGWWLARSYCIWQFFVISMEGK